ncbi:MAG TPA: OmpA family protein [Anaeromyxobacteraceae bacterium]|nr:OmpA family protein [Anaeromyxobacteraceae bacterium]
MRKLIFGLATAAIAFSVRAQAPQAATGDYQLNPNTKYNLLALQRTESGVVTGAVESIDVANRAAVIKGQSGTRYGVRAGKNVQNFEQIHVDDVITADYYRRATFWVAKPADATKPKIVEALVVGAQPKNVAEAAEVKATGSATVESVDQAAGTVTFKGAEGRVYPVKVSNPLVLAGLKPGQTVDYDLVEAAATDIQVFPKPPPPPPPPPPPVEHPRAKLVAKTIEITEQVFFDSNKATIQPKSFGLLDDVAAVMKENPNLKFRVEGNTSKDPDSVKRGKAGYEFNMKLSQERADSVKKYLVDKGVNPASLETIGYGWNRPIVPNTTAAVRAKNRRVDFVVIQ